MKLIPGNAEPQLDTAAPRGTAYLVKVLYFRGYLQHCDQMGLLQFITWKRPSWGSAFPGTAFNLPTFVDDLLFLSLCAALLDFNEYP